MKQTSLGLGASTKRTRRRKFLEEMDRVVPWSELVALIAPFMPEGKRGRQPFPVESLLRIHFMQQWFTLSAPSMEEALHDVPLFRNFAGLSGWDDRLPDESTILRFRHVLEKHKLRRTDFGDYQCTAERQGPDAAPRHGGRCHADLGAQLDPERQRRTRPGDEAKP